MRSWPARSFSRRRRTWPSRRLSARSSTPPPDRLQTAGLGHALPAGVSNQDVIDWVLDGGIDRQPGDPANPKPTDQTPDDVALHKALGKTIESLKGTKEMRRIKGMYVPLMREGSLFFTARKPIAVPAGAVLDKKDKTGTHLVFRNANRKANDKAVKDFLEQTEDVATHKISEFIDPLTGKKTSATNVYADPNNPTGPLIQPVQQWRIVMQDKHMEMSDSEEGLIKSRQNYIDQGYKDVSSVAMLDTVMHGDSELLPQHINRLLKSVRQSSPGNQTAAQANVEGAIVAGWIRQLGGTRAQHRRLKRNTVAGFAEDFIKAIHSAGRANAGLLAQLDYAPKMARAEARLQKRINDDRQAGKDKVLTQQSYYAEIKNRMNAALKRTEDSTGDRAVNSLMTASFINNLVSVAYSIFNIVGGQVSSFSHLVGQFGFGKGARLYGQALMMISPHKILWGGGADTLKSIYHIADKVAFEGRDYDSAVRKWTSGVPGFDKALDRANDLGMGAATGLETPEVGELDKGRIETGLNRGAIIGRQMPQAVEATNRTGALLAFYMGAKENGMSDAEAAEFATSMVEKSQGNYAAENYPTFMSGKYSRVAFQFKKYPVMLAQAYFGSFIRMMPFLNKPGPQRRQAARTFAWMTGTLIAMAGTHGLPFMELAKITFLLATFLGGKVGDWEEKENWMQEMYAKGFQWLGGSKSNAQFYSEMLAYGLPRAMNMETSRRLGTAEVFTHGAPKVDKDGAHWAEWLIEQSIGAPGGMAVNGYKAWADGDITKIPMPKFMRDIAQGGEDGDGRRTPASRAASTPSRRAPTARR